MFPDEADDVAAAGVPQGKISVSRLKIFEAAVIKPNAPPGSVLHIG